MATTVIHGKFTKELSIFDVELRGSGNTYRVSFNTPYPDVISGNLTTVQISKKADGNWRFVKFLSKRGAAYNVINKQSKTKRVVANMEAARLEQEQDKALTASKFTNRIRVKKEKKKK